MRYDACLFEYLYLLYIVIAISHPEKDSFDSKKCSFATRLKKKISLNRTYTFCYIRLCSDFPNATRIRYHFNFVVYRTLNKDDMTLRKHFLYEKNIQFRECKNIGVNSDR